MITGNLTTNEMTSLESAKSFMETINSFEAVVVKIGIAAKEINAFMNKHPLKKEKKFKIESTLKYFYHNGNVDSSKLVLLHALEHLNLNELSHNAHVRDGMGRRKNGLKFNNAIKNRKNYEVKVKAMQEMIVRKTKLNFVGHEASKLFGNEEYTCVVRSFMINKNNNEIKHYWNAHHPFFKDSIDGDDEIFSVNDIARGLVKAHESRT